MSGHSSQLIVLLILMSLSALSWLIGKLREQQQVRRAKEEARRRFEEQLRTGRPPEVQPTESRAGAGSPESLAARRQAQLRDLRKQQQEQMRTARSPNDLSQRRGSQTGQPLPNVILVPPGTGQRGSTSIPIPNPGPGSPAGGRGGLVRPRGPQGPVIIERVPASQGRQPVSRREPIQPPPVGSPRIGSGGPGAPGGAGVPGATSIPVPLARQSASPAESIARSGRSDGGVGLSGGSRSLATVLSPDGSAPTRDQLRRAILSAEIFAKPVSERGPSDDPIGSR